MALPPLELFSLERKGRLLPGGLFICRDDRDYVIERARINIVRARRAFSNQELPSPA